MQNCTESREWAGVLNQHNVHLVGMLDEDSSRAVLLFRIHYFNCLPSVAGFFGMKGAGISGITQTASLSWYTPLPLTASVAGLCAAVEIRGKMLSLTFKLLPRDIWEISRIWKRTKMS